MPKKIDPANADLRELGQANDYSKMDWQERRESRVYWNSLTIEDPAFAGRPVIFLNDINVTGAQQEGMRRYFEKSTRRALSGRTSLRSIC